MTTPRKTKAKEKASPVARKTKAAAPKRHPPKPKVAAKKKVDAKVRTPKRAEPKLPAKPKKRVSKTPVRKKAATAKAAKPRPLAKPKPPKLPKPKPAKPKPPKLPKPKPAKPSVDRALRKQLREALVAQRERLLAVVQSAKAQLAAKQTDLADVSDRASEGYGDELAVGLMAIEAAQLEDIETAIRRIDQSTYGLCTACNKAIPRRRLEVLPFARRCLDCEGMKERGGPAVGAYADTED